MAGVRGVAATARGTVIGMAAFQESLQEDSQVVRDWSFESQDEAAAKTVVADLPPLMFDVHAHLWCKNALSVPPGNIFATGPDEATPAVWREHVGRQVGRDRLNGALFLPMPFVPPEGIVAVNAWMMKVTDGLTNAKAFALVAPSMSAADVEPLLEHGQFAGFKPYHTYSTSQPTYDALPGDYIPEWVWALAHKHGLAMTLHLVRAGALSDAGNLRYLRERCERFPGARVILAHCGRAFHAPNAAAGIASLCDLPNVWFDTAAICEAEPIHVLLDACGPRRLLWGSDFPVSEMRGRAVTAGDGFFWIAPADVKPGPVACRLLPVGLESLRAHRTAAREFGLNADDLQDIFADNARRVLGLMPEVPSRSQALYRHAKDRMPGGTQLLSKRPERFAPEQWPPYFREARGCELWDLDGRHFYDMSLMGIGSCLLGYRDPDVTRAVVRRVRLGSMSTLNPPEEVELADLLCELHPWAEQVRFQRCGGEAMAAAVRIARATTRRSKIALCGYHGWHDWYLAVNLGTENGLEGHLLPGLQPTGVPAELKGTAVPFHYNSIAEFDAALDACGKDLAAVVMEPCRSVAPAPGFLEHIRERTRACGALWVLDEVSAGFRFALGGAHKNYGVTPDMAVFAKAMGNGHPIAAVIGVAEAMSGSHESFISSTYWTESVGPVAGLATLRKMRQHDIPGHVRRIGTAIQDHWRRLARKHALDVEVAGFPCLAHFEFKHPKAEALRTLYAQWMLERGFLAGTAFYPSWAHSSEIVAQYAKAVDEVFGRIAESLRTGEPEKHLHGPVAHTGFRRLT